ncbi:MAG: ABC transporter permease [Acidobacteriota bacterium]
MESLMQDLLYAGRMLMKKPAFTLIAILTMGLGIGANTAIFTVVNSVLLRSLPYTEPERLVSVGRSYAVEDINRTTEKKFLFWRENSQSFEAMAAYQSIAGFNLSGEGEPEYVTGMRVSTDFFRVLGIGLNGRSFTEEEDSPGGERVAIISDHLRRRHFGDGEVIGKTISLDSQPHTIIGSLPPAFRFIPDADVFVSLRAAQGIQQSGYNCSVIARLKRDVSMEQARAEVKLVGEKYRAQFPKGMHERESVGIALYRELLVRDIRPTLWMLLGAVGFVLLIACANVANLQMTRATARHREMAIRQALGARWSRLARQLLTESLLLALAGGSAGLLLALWGTDALGSIIPEGLIPRSAEIGFDPQVLLFTLAISIVTGLIFGLAPAIQISRINFNNALKESSGKGIAGASRGRMRSAIVVVEVALSLVLLVGAGLMIRTFANLMRVETGFDPRNVLTFQVTPSGDGYDSTAETTQFYERALERIKSLPGVKAAAVTSGVPLDSGLNLPVEFDGKTDIVAIQYRMITEDYFRVMKVPLIAGREFDATDSEGAQGVVIINQSLARRYYPDADPLGKRVFIARTLGELGDPKPKTIVGIVGDTEKFNLTDPAEPSFFVPAVQVPTPLMLQMRQWAGADFAIRTTDDPMTLAAAVKKEMAAVDPALPLKRIRSMEQILARSISGERFYMTMLGIFAALGLALALVGIYGVMSYAVEQRTHEFGVRLALGARRADVLGLVLRHGMTLAVIGVALGLASAFALTRLMSSLLYGVSATDWVTLAGVSVFVTGVALGACAVPARRATRVDPMVALRYE